MPAVRCVRRAIARLVDIDSAIARGPGGPQTARYTWAMAETTELSSERAEKVHAAYLTRRAERFKDRPRLPSLTRAEFRALLEGAEPATEDDVPWTFPVRTPVRRDAPT